MWGTKNNFRTKKTVYHLYIEVHIVMGLVKLEFGIEVLSLYVNMYR